MPCHVPIDKTSARVGGGNVSFGYNRVLLLLCLLFFSLVCVCACLKSESLCVWLIYSLLSYKKREEHTMARQVTAWHENSKSGSSGGGGGSEDGASSNESSGILYEM